VLASSATQLIERLRHGEVQGKGLWQRLRGIPRAHYGMLVAHCGIAVFILGVTVVKGYESDKDVKMQVGETVEVGGYTFRFMGERDVQGPNYVAARGTLEITRDGKPVATVSPEKRVYNVQRMPMTEAAIHRSLWRDLYISMGEPVEGGAWIVQVRHKPLVNWIWIGCVIMALGGLLAASDRRYRLAMRRETKVETAAKAVPGKGQVPAPAR
jgi:cytochrome c-type biogenesis protein CcmF